MMSKDQIIVTQVAAKIAAELVNKTNDNDANVSAWIIGFDVVNEALLRACGLIAVTTDEAMNSVQEAFGSMEVQAQTIKPAYNLPRAQPAMANTDGDFKVQIAGTQHGDLPSWLHKACQKSGVTRVWDNRDQAVGTRRPWFKQADNAEGSEATAFWPPKGA